mmetsp:Transcript_5565/g.10176  ORF Transcript_5565/g.10176 Transcript_5565/m.10176 type:complete len:240 (-) Transcript_5565:49-768(-)
MNVIAEIHRINAAELEQGVCGTSASWHAKYAESAWVYVGNLPLQLTEGDIICVMSQFGEVEDINLVREENTGKSRGFAFVKYEDARSCVLAVDNITGSKILGRSIRVDHVEKYRLPKHLLEKEEAISTNPGHAYEGKELASEFRLDQGQDLFAQPSTDNDAKERHISNQERKEAKRKRREEREAKRRKKEARREEREERKRLHRSKKYRESDDEEDNRQKKKKRHRRKHSRSRSRSHDK